MGLDETWSGSMGVLRVTKLSMKRLAPSEFEKPVDELSNRLPDCRHEQWNHRTIFRHMFQISSGQIEADSEFEWIVQEREEYRDGIQAYRLLQIHCGPATYNTAGLTMRAINEAGNKKTRTHEEMWSNIRGLSTAQVV